ncbi:MAG: TlpA family protein disulfide reductase [Gammaproteobacteria bacterium]|nr:MAG: TlpA family protein disulfide reductase [Gammaproteobacteria bacterium]
MKRIISALLAMAVLSAVSSGAVLADEKKALTTALPSKSASAWDQPRFELKGLDGKTHSLDEWKGKVILMNFWASWCAPCQYEIPEFVKYQKQYGDRGLQIIGIGIDEEKKLRNVARSLDINYPVLVADPGDPAHIKILEQWGNEKQFIPYTVVIRKDGRISYIHRGMLDEEAFKEYVRPVLDASEEGA